MAKISEQLWQENAALWAHSHPKEAIWLQLVDVGHLRLKKLSNGFLSLRYKENDFSFSYHSEKDPLGEAKERLEGFDLGKTDLLIIYGVGLGYDFLAAKDWLNESAKRQLIFIEDDLGVISRFFKTDIAKELLNHPQAQLTYIQNLEMSSHVFNDLFWHFHGLSFKILPSVSYKIYRPAFYEELHRQLSFEMETKQSLLEEYLEFGAAFFRNFYLNLLEWDKALLGNTLFGQFKNVPAIICGAGPSLQKNVEQLKSLSDQALIFGGSSSLNALQSVGVVPHFGVGIDPNAKQAERFKELPRLDFPFFYRQRLFPEALKLVRGPRLYITGTGGYSAAGWFEKKLGIETEEIEEGHNVINFSLGLACRLGCNPIIFIGMDLGFTDMKLYSPGVISKSNKLEDNDLRSESLPPDLLIKKDINGKPLYTLWKWISEAKWISDFAEEHPDLTLINATEGGLGFSGVENQAFSEAVKEWMGKPCHLSSRISQLLKNAEISELKKSRIVELMYQLRKSLVRCIDGFEILIQENEKVKEKAKEGEVRGHSQSARSALVETELTGEAAFEAVLEVFNSVYTRYLDKEVKDLADPASVLSENQKFLRRLDLNERKYCFLQQVAQVNLKLLDFALNQL